MVDKIDLSFKKLVGKEYTSTAKPWYEEFSTKEFNLHATDIWIDEIPPTPPTLDTSTIKIYNTLALVEDLSVNSHKAWLAEDPIGTRVGNFISPRYGQGYTVRVYDGSGDEIPTTDKSSWYFDYTNGILVFDYNPAIYGWDISGFRIKAYRYIGLTVHDMTTSSGALEASDIFNDSMISGSTVKDALNTLNNGDFLIDRMVFNQPLVVTSGVSIYTLPDLPIQETVQVFINGLLQEQGVGKDYTVVGNSIIFHEPVEVDDIVLASYIKQ